MTRINRNVIVHLADHTQTLDNLEHVASHEVGTTDATTEQSVARECHLLLLAEEENATR